MLGSLRIGHARAVLEERCEVAIVVCGLTSCRAGRRGWCGIPNSPCGVTNSRARRRWVVRGHEFPVRGGEGWCGVTNSRCGATNCRARRRGDGAGPRILRARRRSPVRGPECSASQLRSAVRGHERSPSQRGAALRGADRPCEVPRSAPRTSEGPCEVPVVRASSRCWRVRGSEPLLSIIKVAQGCLRTRLGALRLRSRPAVARIHRIFLPTNGGGGLHCVRGRRHERPLASSILRAQTRADIDARRHPPAELRARDVEHRRIASSLEHAGAWRAKMPFAAARSPRARRRTRPRRGGIAGARERRSAEGRPPATQHEIRDIAAVFAASLAPERSAIRIERPIGWARLAAAATRSFALDGEDLPR